MKGRAPRAWTRAAVPLGLVLAAAAASLLPDLFVLDRSALARGEVWRLWTGHLVHLTTGHFLLDVGVGAILLLLVRSRGALLLLPPVVGLGVLLLRPDLGVYAGLSGVLHGWTVLAALDLARGSRGIERGLAWALLLGVLGKAVYETLAAANLLTASVAMGADTVHVAHLVGCAAGLGWAALEGARVFASRPAARRI